MNNNESAFYRKRLQSLLAERCDRNPRYSVRAFARALDIDVGTLSRVLSGKQIPSFKLSQRLTSGMDLTAEEERKFIASVAETQRSRGTERLNPVFRSIREGVTPAADLSIDHYRIIADWYHVAILELTFNEDFESSPRWIAKELGISAAEASLAINRLLEFGLLKKDSQGRLRKTDARLTTADKHLSTPALRKNQKQFLEKAIHSLENDPIESRNISSMTMSIDPDQLPLARQMIREFNQSLGKLLESGKRKRVYNLEIALYPIQKQPTKTKQKRRNQSETSIHAQLGFCSSGTQPYAKRAGGHSDRRCSG